jgi:molybdate transport system regulatory protein
MAKAKTNVARLRILIGAATSLGPGKADLLEAITRQGSISAAARAMGMSYRRAWILVDTMSRKFRDDVVVTATGGRGGGGAQVTSFGLEVLARYRRTEAKAAAAVEDDMAAFARLMAGPRRRG